MSHPVHSRLEREIDAHHPTAKQSIMIATNDSTLGSTSCAWSES